VVENASALFRELRAAIRGLSGPKYAAAGKEKEFAMTRASLPAPDGGCAAQILIHLCDPWLRILRVQSED
jgi:hypothetical protein